VISQSKTTQLMSKISQELCVNYFVG